MRGFVTCALVLAAMLGSVAQAHGLLARVRTAGTTLTGTAYYSSGEPARGEWVEIFDIAGSAPGPVAAFAADTGGSFRHEGIAGHRYRIVVHGDEGHSIELEIALAANARARLVEPAGMAAGDDSGAPAWAVVGVVLLLVSLVAAPFGRRRGGRGDVTIAPFDSPP